MPKRKTKSATKPVQKKLPDSFSTTLIIPCYWINRELIDATECCLLSLAESGARVDQLIIVDDGSPEGMAPDPYFLKRTNARIVHVEANRGYTIAVNRGIEAASGSVVIIGNNDLLFPKGWLEALLEPLKRGFDIASLPTVEPKRPFVPSNTIGENEKFGALFAVGRHVIDTVGNLDEDLGRGYFTDLDFQKRSEQAGFKSGANHAVCVQHIPKSTFKVVDPDDKMYLESKTAFEKKWGKVS